MLDYALRMKKILAVAILVAAAAGGYALWRQSRSTPTSTASKQDAEAGTKTSAAEQAQQQLAKQSSRAPKEPRAPKELVSKSVAFSATKKQNHMRTPDGQWVAALNGAVDPPNLDWPRDRQWSPIKRKIIDKVGTEWYEHEDGSYSTNFMLFRSDLGRKEAVTHIVHPEKALPLDPSGLDPKGLGPRSDK